MLKKKPLKGHTVFNICSNKPIKITKILDIISKEVKHKPKIYKREFQQADVVKTHGNNDKIKKYTNIKKFTETSLAISSVANWYKKNWKIFN